MTSTADAQRLTVLYGDHHRWLQSWLRHRLGCQQQAADLAHDTFLRLITRHQLPDLSKPRALLTHIAKGLVIDHWRRQDVERAYLDALAQLPEPVAPSPEERQLVLEALYQIERMLREMPMLTREIFLLAQLDGMTYKDIAGHCGVSLSTVKRHMRDGFMACLSAS